MELEIVRASRKRVKLRMLIDGPSGAGKTANALQFATALKRRYGGEIGVIGTEGGKDAARDENYVDTPFAPEGFDRIGLYGDKTVSNYCAAINRFKAKGGYSVVVIDSLSHAWAGKGGLLEEVEKYRERDDDFAKWREGGKVQNTLIETIVTAPFHIIATLRSKTDWSYVDNPNKPGKKMPVRIGLAPVQRKEIEYEFNIYCGIDTDHVLTVYKSDCTEIDKVVVERPTMAFMDPIMEWLDTGKVEQPVVAVRRASELLIRRFLEVAKIQARISEDAIRAGFKEKFGMYLEDAPAEFIEEKLAEMEKKPSISTPTRSTRLSSTQPKEDPKPE